MYFMNADMTSLYKNKNPAYCNDMLDNRSLSLYLERIEEQRVREVVSVLIGYEARDRVKVYDVLDRIKISGEMRLFKENPFSIRS